MKKLILATFVVLAFSNIAFAKTEDMTIRTTTKADGTITTSEETSIRKDKTIYITKKESIKLPNGKVIKAVTESKVLDNGNRSEGRAVTRYDKGKTETSEWKEELILRKL